MTGLAARPRLARRARLRWDPVRQKPLLLVPEGVLVLNRTAYEVVRRMDGTWTAAELASALAAEYREPRVEREVLAFLARLAAKGLLEEGPAPGGSAPTAHRRAAGAPAPAGAPGRSTRSRSSRPRRR